VSDFQIVIDTNVFISALRSRRGASYKLLTLLDSGKFEINLSVPLVLEYEAIAKRMADEFQLSVETIDDILDYTYKVANHWKIHFLWRPILKDPADDMILELAVTAGCSYIVTYNKRDFNEAESFGIQVLTPKELLDEIGELR
jgi:putative PIN family toxin of toxin-antitoxin system